MWYENLFVQIQWFVTELICLSDNASFENDPTERVDYFLD